MDSRGRRIGGLALVAVGLAAAARSGATSPFSASCRPSGVLGHGVLGGLTVEFGLKPGFVMAHFGLSMLLLVAAFALAWRATYERGARPEATDAVSVWAVRALLGFGALVIFVGTVATAAGPHAGGSGTDDVVDRLMFKGTETLLWTIRYHARLAGALGVAAVAVWFLLRPRGAERQVRRAVTVLAAQGVTGTIQYHLLNLPPDRLVARTHRGRFLPRRRPPSDGLGAGLPELAQVPGPYGTARRSPPSADSAYGRELAVSRSDGGGRSRPGQ